MALVRLCLMFFAQLAFARASGSCPCEDQALCRPLQTSPPQHELLAFSVGDNWKHYLHYSPRVTTIAVFAGTPPPELVCAAHRQETRVVIGLGGPPKSQLGNASARSEYVKDIVANMTSLGIDGLNVDVEGNDANRDGLTALVTELAQKAREANPLAQITFDFTVLPQSQTAGYDYASLAKVLDFVVPMAYDECYNSAVAAANSPIKALSVSVKQFSEFGIPASKIVMGLPWYGYDFPCDSPDPNSICRVTVPKGKRWGDYATQVPYKIANVTAQHGFRVDEGSMSIVAEYTENNEGPVKRHQRWFDNPGTLAAKYREAARLGCRGVAFWTADCADYSATQGLEMWETLSEFFSPRPSPIVV